MVAMTLYAPSPEEVLVCQGNYYSEPYGTPHTETAQAKDQTLADSYWILSSELIRSIIGEDLS